MNDAERYPELAIESEDHSEASYITLDLVHYDENEKLPDKHFHINFTIRELLEITYAHFENHIEETSS